MIESWCEEINDQISQKAGVVELVGYDPRHDRYETYCETVVRFRMFGIPRSGYDLGGRILCGFIERDVMTRVQQMKMMTEDTE